MSDFEGRVAVVTGGATELDAAVAHALAQAGCRVLVDDNDRSRSLGALAANNPESGIEWLPIDASDQASARATFREAKRRWGRLDVLVQHHPTTYRGEALSASLAAWQRDLDVLTTTFLMSQAFASEAEPHSAIINIASLDVAQAYPGRLTASAVANGLVGLSRALAVEWATRPIRVNVIAPGIMLTDLERAAIDSGQQSLERVLLRAPSHRLGTPEETASAVLFLASMRADFITGQSLSIDGGWSALTQHAEGLRFP